MDREGRGSVRSGKEIREELDRGARLDLGALVHAVRPNDLLGRRHRLRFGGIGEAYVHLLTSRPEFPPAGFEDAAAPANLLLLGRKWNRLVGFLLGEVLQCSRG